MKPASSFRIGALTGLLLVAATLPRPAVAQIEEADLPPETFQQLAYQNLTFDELDRRFAKAEATFVEDLDPEKALPLFADLIEVLEARVKAPLAPGADERDPRDFDLLAKSLGYSARINFNLGGDSNVEEDLRRLLELDPGFAFDSAIVSPKLLQRFDALKRKTVGTLALTLRPPDATLLVDDRPTDPSRGPVAVPVGTRRLVVQRPGFASVEMAVEVLPGKELPLNLELERDSAMVLLVSRPSRAQVLVDGQPAGVTSGTLGDDFPLTGEAARFSRDEFSGPIKVGGLDLGRHRIEVVKEGFRPYRFEVDIPELKDYNAGVALLEATGGLVILRGLPRGATVAIGGRAVRPVPVNRTDGQLKLAPGNYRIGVTDGASGFFQVDVSL
ncbi:MAG: PEGA domain-containing protein, partial [Acidobacteria bacterium]|nr:PEGA domain-containing protein [Acidobacteriota bacterium]